MRSVITVCARTDIGRVRKNNEDAFVVADLGTGWRLERESWPVPLALTERGALLAVSDGMGGHAGGEVASALTVEALRGALNAWQGEPGDALKSAVLEASRRVREAAEGEGPEGMGATLTAALIQGPHAHLAEVGDSRAYLLRGEALVQVTRDQSWVQFLIDQEGFSRERAAESRLRNVVLQAIGQGSEVRPAIQRVALRRGDRLLLCSDGLSNKVAEADVRGILRGTDVLDAACARLVEAANERGGDDNITVILSAFDGPGWPEAAAGESVADTIVTLAPFGLPGGRDDP